MTMVACSPSSNADRDDVGPVETTSDEPAAPAETVRQPADDSGDEPVGTVGALIDLLPPDTRAVAVIDIESLVWNGVDVAGWLDGEARHPALAGPFRDLGLFAETVDVSGAISEALVVHTSDAAAGPLLVARARTESIAGIVTGEPPDPAGEYGPNAHVLYVAADGTRLVLVPGGVVLAGDATVVASVLDVVDGAQPVGAGAITPFLPTLDDTAHVRFAFGLPALFGDVAPDRTLRSAAVMSGAFDVSDGAIVGVLAFHTPNATEFVDTFNELNRPATQGDDAIEVPLVLADPHVDGLGQVVVTMPVAPIDPSPDDLLPLRNLVKKLVAGMEADDDAAGVADRTDPAWLDFVVTSEQDTETPPSPGSVYIRWEFRDEAAVRAFEQNELPAGFRLAPTRFLETDDPEGGYFLALNLYNAGGGTVVSGARAEWDVFVHPPAGADPNAGERPRFMVVDVLAAEVSADARDLLTPAHPLSHELVDGLVVSNVRRFEGDGAVDVFASAFPVPDPAEAEVARFTREMAIGNDYIYWAHGVSDRVLYNATTFNHDAYFVDTTQLTFTDDSRWAQYLNPEVKDAVYYVNTLEYVASPMANLDSEYLDITPEWLAALVGFTTNGHQEGLMRAGVEQLFRGTGDAFVGMRLGNETPATFYHFEITDPDALEAALDLPPGHRLAPTTLFEGGDEGQYLTLSVYEIDGAVEGMRAEWAIYVDDGSGRPPHLVIVELMTEEVAFDPLGIVNLPSGVRHDVLDGVATTRLSSPGITFEASFEMAGTTEEELSLDWIEAGDDVCRLHGPCDRYYYDAETLDVPVHVPAEVTVPEFSTPWSDVVEAQPAVVFYRDNAQEYAVKRWYDLDVPVGELAFDGLEDRTHVIGGNGNLVGRTTDIADSDYVYSGDAVLDGGRLAFAIDQEVRNALGVGHIFTTGSFDLETGTGTQTVVDCQGPALLCSDIENGSTAFYTAQQLDVSDPDTISWQVDVVVDLGGSFGTADSASTFTATRTG